MNYKEIKLGLEAITYLKDRLSCGNTLANILLQNCDFEVGSIFTILPANISDEVAKEFKTGGKLPSLLAADYEQSNLEPIADMDSQLVTDIHVFLSANEGHVCVFEDASAERNYPFLQALDTRFSFFNDEVYHLLSHEDLDDNKILKTIRAARSWLFIGIMASVSQDISLSLEHKDLTMDDLNLLAKGTEKIIVGAYDGEGYLIWDR
jgi:hypothetical protein